MQMPAKVRKDSAPWRARTVLVATLFLVLCGGCASSVTEGLSSAVAHLAEAMLLSLFI